MLVCAAATTTAAVVAAAGESQRRTSRARCGDVWNHDQRRHTRCNSVICSAADEQTFTFTSGGQHTRTRARGRCPQLITLFSVACHVLQISQAVQVRGRSVSRDRQVRVWRGALSRRRGFVAHRVCARRLRQAQRHEVQHAPSVGGR